MSLRRVMRLRRQTLPVAPKPTAPVFLDDFFHPMEAELVHALYRLIAAKRTNPVRLWNVPFTGSLPSGKR